MNIKMNIPNPDNFLDEKHRNPIIFHMLSSLTEASRLVPRMSQVQFQKLHPARQPVLRTDVCFGAEPLLENIMVDPFGAPENSKRCFFRVMKNHDKNHESTGKYGMENLEDV